MAVPLWVYWAALAAGTAAQVRSQNMKMDAAAAAQRRYADRTDKSAAKAESLFQDSLTDYQEDPRSQANRAADERVDRTEGLIDSQDFDPLRGGLDDAEGGTRKSIAKLIGQEIDKGKGQIKAKAMLEGYSDRNFEQQIRNYGRAAELGVLGTIDQSNRNILNADMTASQEKGQGTAMAGDLLTLIGMVGTMNAGGAAGAPQATVINPANPAHQQMAQRFSWHKALTGGIP